jgi:hypothetical protein
MRFYVVLTAAVMRVCVILQRKELYLGVNSVFNISLCGVCMHDLRMELYDVLGLRSMWLCSAAPKGAESVDDDEHEGQEILSCSVNERYC